MLLENRDQLCGGVCDYVHPCWFFNSAHEAFTEAVVRQIEGARI